MRRVASLIAAACFAALILHGVGAFSPRDALAYVPDNPSRNLSHDQKIKLFRYYIGETQIQPTGDPAKAERAERYRRMWQRATRKGMPTLTKHMMTKGGLGGAAAGIWLHNGITLYNGLFPESSTGQLPIGLEFREAPGALKITGKNSDGSTGSVAYISRFDYEVISGEVQATLKVETAPGGLVCGPEFCKSTGGYIDLSRISSSSAVWRTESGALTAPVSTNVSGPHAGDGSDFKYSTPVVYTTKYPYEASGLWVTDTGGPWRKVRDLARDSVVITPEVYEVGNVTSAPPEYTPGSGDYLASPAESDATLDAFRADPEYNPTTDNPSSPEPKTKEELERDHGGPGVETWTNSDGSISTRYPDGTIVTNWNDGTQLRQTPGKPDLWAGPGAEWTGDKPTDPTRYPYPDPPPSTGTVTPTEPGTGTPTEPGTGTPTEPGTGTPTEPGTGTNDGTETGTPTEPGTGTNDGTETGTPTEPGTGTSDGTETGTPPGGGDGGTGTGTGTTTCEQLKPYRFDLPRFQLFNVFPFSLVLKAWSLTQSLVATPERPSFDLPMFGTVTVPDSMDEGIGWFRAAVSITFLIGMCWMFYRSISGAGGGGGG